MLASDSGRGEVSEELAQAIGHGITGVPTYVIDGAWAIPGAQDTDTFERVIRRSIERKAASAE
jgi:predicted DsbA family dithiol-disulfide isomerase